MIFSANGGFGLQKFLAHKANNTQTIGNISFFYVNILFNFLLIGEEFTKISSSGSYAVNFNFFVIFLYPSTLVIYQIVINIILLIEQQGTV